MLEYSFKLLMQCVGTLKYRVDFFFLSYKYYP